VAVNAKFIELKRGPLSINGKSKDNELWLGAQLAYWTNEVMFMADPGGNVLRPVW
jgi:hypothetical protein